MRRGHLRRIAPFVLLFAACSLNISACKAQSSSANPKQRMNEIVQSYVDSKQFMGTILVTRGDEILLDKGYGFANLEWQIPNVPEAKFRLGSITKQFTAASILLLEERGKLSTDDLVKKYMPDAAAAWDKVTIYNLLTHTSGIPSFTDFPDYRSTEATPTTPEKLVARFRDKPLEFRPGEKWKYSNSGYVLLGYLLEKISGQSYQDFVTQNIFKPLGMNDSGYDSNSAIILHRAYGYAPGPNGSVNAGYVDMTIPFSAGSLYSTTHDLLRWEQGLFGGKVLSATSLKKMTTPFKENYACGLMVTTVNGHRLIEHGGGIEGFNTELAYYPDDKLTIVALGNLNGGAPGDIASKLGAAAHGEKVVLASERKEITVPPAVLSSYVGTYELAPGFSIAITLENGQLMEQATNQQKFPIFAESPTKFFLKVVDAQIEFVKNDKGEVTAMILHQGGRDMKGAKVHGEKAVPPPERKEITVSPTVLSSYVGTYELAPDFSIVITSENGQLMEQATNQPKFPIFPESPTKFFLKVVDAQIEFVKNEKGDVTAMILHQNGRDIKGLKK